jgi:hypothetical protein
MYHTSRQVNKKKGKIQSMAPTNAQVRTININQAWSSDRGLKHLKHAWFSRIGIAYEKMK